MSQSKVTFDPGDIIGTSWGIFKNNVGPLLGGNLVMLIILCVSGMVPFGSLVLAGPLMLGMYKMTRVAIRGEAVEFGYLFSGFQKFLPAFLASLLITIFSCIGMIFCIIPGILISILYLPTYLFILDDNLEFWDAMEASRRMVMNNFGQWIVLGLVLFLLNVAGFLACGVGSLVTMPMTYIAIALAFDQEHQVFAPVPPPVPPFTPEEPSA
jgi:uncharacterized membrane protein